MNPYESPQLIDEPALADVREPIAVVLLAVGFGLAVAFLATGSFACWGLSIFFCLATIISSLAARCDA